MPPITLLITLHLIQTTILPITQTTMAPTMNLGTTGETTEGSSESVMTMGKDKMVGSRPNYSF
jgi:hypothetical protein